MNRKHLLKLATVALLGMVVVALSSAALAQVKAEGLIKGRNGEQIILQTTDNPNMVVLLTENTDVAQVQGPLKARHKEMSMAALIPGLKVSVEGTMNDQQQLVATKVRFTGKDLQQAQKIQAGMHETAALSAQNQAELQKQNEALQAQNEALKSQQEQLSAQQLEIQKNKQEIAAATARFGQLDDYYIRDEVTVLFGNGKTKVDPQYISQIMAMADKAKNINGYMIEVKGYASAVGSQALNQKLSAERATNVTNVLLQQAHVPMTRMLSPAAMGESDQIGNDKTAEGQAENRRVVVRVLQNKGVAGI
jgi:outer membrane protein OmpA-like peptidoglycan-associated protein